MKPSNPFLSPDYEAHLEALTHGPMTSNQHGALIRPVDQMAEAVRTLHGKVAGMWKALECQKCYCVYAVNPQNMSAAAIESGAESELIQQCARCAALAAWKEATRG